VGKNNKILLGARLFLSLLGRIYQRTYEETKFSKYAIFAKWK